MRPDASSSRSAAIGEAADHEGFADLDAGAFTDGEQRFRFGDGEAERLFAENVLAGLGGPDGPGHVHLIGQGIVDGVDFGVGEQLFDRTRMLWEYPAQRRLSGADEVAGGDGIDAGVTAKLHGRQNFLIPMFAVLRTPQRSFFCMEK